LIRKAPLNERSLRLLAALSNAANVITQHIASTSDPAGSSGWRLVVYLFRNPLWLFGWIALVGAFVFQALASVTASSRGPDADGHELVFGLLIRKVWIHQSIRPVAWASAVLTCVGIGVFVAMAEPQGGNPTPSSHAWASALAVFGGAAAILTSWPCAAPGSSCSALRCRGRNGVGT